MPAAWGLEMNFQGFFSLPGANWRIPPARVDMAQVPLAYTWLGLSLHCEALHASSPSIRVLGGRSEAVPWALGLPPST